MLGNGDWLRPLLDTGRAVGDGMRAYDTKRNQYTERYCGLVAWLPGSQVPDGFLMQAKFLFCFHGPLLSKLLTSAAPDE